MHDFVIFHGSFISFEKLETWLSSAFLSKVMSFHERKLASWSRWQSLPFVDYRKKEVFTEFSEFQSCSIKSFFISNWCWTHCLIVSANLQLKFVWCSSVSCWWYKDLKSLALPLEPVLTPWVKSTNKIRSPRKRNHLCYLHQGFYCKILM